MGETRGTIEALRRGAAECEAAGVAGWGNTMATAADALLAAIARAEAAEKRADDYQALYEAEQKAVWHAEREQRVQAQLAADCMDARDALAANNARLREALEWYAAYPGKDVYGAEVGRVARDALRAQPGEELGR